MVGEQAQEMQLAHWIPTTQIPALGSVIPGWMGLWFAVFPTVETLAAQALAAVLVIGSYYGARMLSAAGPEGDVVIPEALESDGVKGAERLEQVL
jgi:hypothetical protein